MFLFGHISGMAVLNGYVQTRSGLSLPQFGLVLATGAVTALLVNLYLRHSGKRLSGSTGLLLLTVASWLPLLAQGLWPLLVAYSVQGAASRIALAGLYRAVTSIQRQSLTLSVNVNATLILESLAGFGLGESFLMNALVTELTGEALWASTLTLFLGVPIAWWLKGRLPVWEGMPTAPPAAIRPEVAAPIGVAFAAYCAEVFTITQATAWSSVLATSVRAGKIALSPLMAAGLLAGVFWMVVGTVRFTTGLRETVDLRRVVAVGNVLCIVAVLGSMWNPNNAWSLMACYALLGAGIACFVPFALQMISMHRRAGEFADRLALLGPVMSVSVHLITGNFAAWREYFVLAALSATLFAAVRK
ncbi:hypothetical protein [Bryobacter aggregatus]|uniref:hypothetical protein n=1 Tax=Bryobacter aggregatus TaxID=360054 RepID=UPI0004E28BF8|nr:hypothetical protein [Bryobacter aggregatus]